MDWALPTIAISLLGFAAVSRRLDGTPITGPIVFMAIGLLVGADSLGLVDPAVSGEAVKLLAEATLALVLFGDASRIDLRVLREEVSIPVRLLGIGLPLTLVAGFGSALVLFDTLSWPEALLLAVILAPTDAALGQAVVTLVRLPSSVRQGLNVESGLNDGICVPLFFIALVITQADAGEVSDISRAKNRGRADRLWDRRRPRRRSAGRGDRHFRSALPVGGRTMAPSRPGGGGGTRVQPRRRPRRVRFIAAFVGGIAFGGLRRRHGNEVGYLLEELGGVLQRGHAHRLRRRHAWVCARRPDVEDPRVCSSSVSRSCGCCRSGSRCSALVLGRRRSASSDGSAPVALHRSCSQ